MSERLQLRGGTAAQVAAFTGAQCEVVVDFTNWRLVLQDGSTVGGYPLAKLSEVGGAVTSVAGRTGAVTLAVADISGAAPLASPALTGTPTSTTTPTAGDASSKLATTAFVAASFVTYAYAAANYATLSNASLTGTPTAPTPAASDNSTKLATTAYVTTAIGALVARTQVSDANYTALASDRTIAVTALTAARTLTLPAASAYPLGATLTLVDESGACSATKTLTLTRAGTDTINGAASAVLSTAYAYLALESNGANKWTLVDQSTQSMAQQVASAIAVTGGSIDGTSIGGTVPAVINGGPLSSPQGRLSLSSGTPVMTSTVTAAATLYYCLVTGNQIPLWNGTNFVLTPFTELSNVLANSATGNAGPSAAAASQVYDLFVWSNGGTVTLTRGPAWSAGTAGSNIARGTGAGGTALARVNGILVNAAAITNGPAAGFGTYVGTIATDAGGGTVTWNLGSAAAGGGAATLNLWNAYNRVTVAPSVQDSTASHTYTSTTIRPLNNSTTNSITFVRGLNEEGVSGLLYEALQTAATAGSQTTILIGLDSTTAGAATSSRGFLYTTTAVSLLLGVTAAYTGFPGLGAHVLQALEQGDGTTVGTYYGSNNNNEQLSAIMRM